MAEIFDWYDTWDEDEEKRLAEEAERRARIDAMPPPDLEDPYLRGMVQNKLKYALEGIRDAEDGTKHATRLARAHLVGGLVALGLIKETDALDMLINAALSNTTKPALAEKDVRDGFAHGIQEPLDLKAELAGRAVEGCSAVCDEGDGDEDRLWTVAELKEIGKKITETEPDKVEWIIPEFIAKGIIGMIYGEGGSYKSLAMLWLMLQRAANAVDSGTKWLGAFEMEAGNSIFFTAEDMELDIHLRTQRIIKELCEKRPDVPESSIARAIQERFLVVPREKWGKDGEMFLLVRGEGKKVEYTKKIRHIIRLIKDFKADLVVIETFSRIMDVDENDNILGAMAVRALEEIRDATGATVLCVSHANKTGRSEQTDKRGQNALRGAGSLLDNSRFGLWFQAVDSEEGENDRIRIVNSKTFRCRRVKPMVFELDYPNLVCVQNETGKEEKDLYNRIIDFVREHDEGCTKRAVRAVRGDNSKIDATLNRALNDGTILQIKNKEGKIVCIYNQEKVEGF